VCAGLARAGWSVRERAVPGAWPGARRADRAALARQLGSVPDGGVVLVDGLVASAAPEAVVPQADRLRLVVLLHLPLGATTDDAATRDDEPAVLRAAARVLVTSAWSRRWLLERYDLPADHVDVAEPGVDLAPEVTGTGTGDRLLCVAALTPGKGHDVLLAALAEVRDLAWHCACVGSVRRDPDHVGRLLRRLRDDGTADRVDLVGPRSGAELAASYAAADLLVLASRFESYGMVVTEALARGVPVLTTTAGGLPATLGRLPDGRRPGLLVPPDAPEALAAALRRWLDDDALRASLRQAARERRTTLTGWDVTTERVSRVLAEVAS
jgi:glycosyltransferase involved in cell wall biosynthesis